VSQLRISVILGEIVRLNYNYLRLVHNHGQKFFCKFGYLSILMPVEMKQARFVFFWCLLSPLLCMGQQLKITGQIRDAETNQFLAGASITHSSTGTGTTSDGNGMFQFSFEGFPTTILIKFIGYKDDTLVINDKDDYYGTYFNRIVAITLTRKVTEIPVVEIKAVNRLFDKDPYAIVQFYISDNQIISLGYRNGNEFRKEILLADVNGKILDKLHIKNLDKMGQDCQGNVFAFTSDSAYHLRHTQNHLKIADNFNRTFIEKFLMPVSSVTDSTTFIHFISPLKQYENYFVINRDTNATIIYSVGRFKNEQGKQSGNEQANRLAAVPITLPPPKIPAGVPSGPIVEAFCKSYERLFQSYFKAEFGAIINYPPVYSQMFRFKGKQLIFNREGKSIAWLDDSGKINQEITFMSELNGKPFSLVLYDAKTQRFYLQFDDDPFTEFIEIDPFTGQHIRTISAGSFRHMNQCCFNDGRLFFLYQPEIGNRLRKVYSISI
jgi:hypothetical protein